MSKLSLNLKIKLLLNAKINVWIPFKKIIVKKVAIIWIKKS